MNKPLTTRRSALMLIIPLAAAGCAGMSAAPAPVLVGTEWRLESLGGKDVPVSSQASLSFPESGRVAGNASCNRFFGSYTLMQDKVALGQLGGTRMACPEAVSEQETRYLDALQKAHRLEVQGKTMLMHVQGLEKPLRFTRTKP
mgnify:CR=1 FL=1